MPPKRSGKARPNREASICEEKLASFLNKLCDSWAHLPRPALRGLINKLREIIDRLEKVASDRAGDDRREARFIEIKKELDSDLDEIDEGHEESADASKEAKRRR